MINVTRDLNITHSSICIIIQMLLCRLFHFWTRTDSQPIPCWHRNELARMASMTGLWPARLTMRWTDVGRLQTSGWTPWQGDRHKDKQGKNIIPHSRQLHTDCRGTQTGKCRWELSEIANCAYSRNTWTKIKANIIIRWAFPQPTIYSMRPDLFQIS